MNVSWLYWLKDWRTFLMRWQSNIIHIWIFEDVGYCCERVADKDLIFKQKCVKMINKVDVFFFMSSFSNSFMFLFSMSDSVFILITYDRAFCLSEHTIQTLSLLIKLILAIQQYFHQYSVLTKVIFHLNYFDQSPNSYAYI